MQKPRLDLDPDKPLAMPRPAPKTSSPKKQGRKQKEVKGRDREPTTE